MALFISERIRAKILSKHDVSEKEAREAYSNRPASHFMFEDTREEQKTHPPTGWFISESNKGRKLKVVVVEHDENVILKTCFEPSESQIQEYESLLGN